MNGDGVEEILLAGVNTDHEQFNYAYDIVASSTGIRVTVREKRRTAEEWAYVLYLFENRLNLKGA